MINNEYIFTPNLDLNLDTIQEIVLRNIATRIPGMASHHRSVKEEPYLQTIHEKYPFLSGVYNIFDTKWDYVTPVHLDANRNCTLNIPVDNVQGSYTVYYKLEEPIVSEYIPKRVYHIIRSKYTESYRFTLDQPTVINTKIPHNIIHNNTTKDRIIMSWSINSNYTFEDIKKILIDKL
jgi:hypothetical protein